MELTVELIFKISFWILFGVHITLWLISTINTYSKSKYCGFISLPMFYTVLKDHLPKMSIAKNDDGVLELYRSDYNRHKVFFTFLHMVLLTTRYDKNGDNRGLKETGMLLDPISYLPAFWILFAFRSKKRRENRDPKFSFNRWNKKEYMINLAKECIKS